MRSPNRTVDDVHVVQRADQLADDPVPINAWLASYHDRPNHGDWMRGRTPNQLLDPDQP